MNHGRPSPRREGRPRGGRGRGGGRSRRVAAPVVAGLLAVFHVGLTATPAAADATCSVSGTQLMVALAADDTITISIVAGPELEIEPADGSCDGHSPTTFTLIDVDGNTGNEQVTIDQGGAGGSFGSAIDFDIHLGAGATDSFRIEGSGGIDAIGFGAAGASFDSTTTVDAVFSGVESFAVNGLGGADAISAAGGDALGAAFATAIGLSGGTDADDLTGGSGNDTLDGGDGDDIADGGAGDDALIGGAAIDTASFESGSAGVTADLRDGTATGQGADTLTGFENLTGGGGDDTLLGDDGANVLRARTGADAISGRGADDLVRGGDGADTVNGDDGNDTVNGGDGNDTGGGGDGDDVVTGGEGGDEASGGNGNDLVKGGTGPDEVGGGNGDDDVRGGPGNDEVDGGKGTDGCTGGAGADSITGCETGRP